MKNFLSGCGLVVCGLGLVVSACSAGTGAAEESGASSAAALAAPAPRRGVMPMKRATAASPAAAREADPAASAVQLQYFGGPVISSVVVHAVYWGRNVAFQSHLDDFYGAVPNSSYMDWLSEYNTPSQHIGRGSFAGSTVITPQRESGTLDDTDIQAELSAQIDAGNLPQPDGKNDLYMIHFPPAVRITGANVGTSCVEFCAYHSAYKKGGKTVTYGILPDLVQTDCATGCGADSPQENTTAVASHEMVEAVTDPEIGLAPASGPPVAPMAWYNSSQGEIGDICNAQHGHEGSFTVQLQWSNHQRKCVEAGPSQ